MIKKKTLKLLLCTLFACLCTTQIAFAQLSYLQINESKKFNFGIGLGVGLHTIGIDKSANFLNQQEFIIIHPNSSPGFFINFISNYNFAKHWAVRSSFPLFHYSNYDISYQKKEGLQNNKQSFVFDYFKLSLPIELIFKSDVINNFRFYISLGAYSAYNFTNNVQLKEIDFLRINKYEQGATIGIGFMFGGEYTISAIELKYQYGFNNIFIHESDNKLSNVIDKLKTRSLIIALNF